MEEAPLNLSIGDNNQTIVEYNSKTESKASEAFNKLRLSVSTLFDTYKAGTLTEGYKSTLLRVSEMYLKEFCDVFGYEGIIKEEQEKRHSKIKAKNIENRELRKQLGEKVSNEDVRERLKNMSETFKKWWNIEGFGHVSELEFVGGGYLKSKLSGMISEAYYLMDEEGNKNETIEDKAKYLKEYGFEFEISEYGRGHMYGSDKNMELLNKLLKSKFPSVKILECVSYSGRGVEQAELREIEIMIYNLEEIK